MKFSLFMYCTIGRRAELEAGMAGQKPGLYPRMLDEIAEYARFADEAGYFGFGHPEQSQGDPRANLLLALADERGVAGQHVEMMRALQAALPETIGRALPVNVNASPVHYAPLRLVG